MTYSPMKCLENIHKMSTMPMALNSNAPSVSKIERMFGKKYVSSYIKAWLMFLNKNVKLKNPLTEGEMEVCASLFVNDPDLRNLKISEITLVFAEAIKGGFGEFYENLNIPKVLGWFKRYYEQRIELAGELSRNEHSQIKDFPFMGNRSSEMTIKDYIKDKNI